MLIFVVIWMTSIFSFSAGKIVYDKHDSKTVTETKVNIQK